MTIYGFRAHFTELKGVGGFIYLSISTPDCVCSILDALFLNDMRNISLALMNARERAHIATNYYEMASKSL